MSKRSAFPKVFWVANGIEVLERFAYYGIYMGFGIYLQQLGYSKGDLLVHVNIWTPKTLNKKQKDFFKEMLGDDNFKPNPKTSDKSFFEKVRDMFA